MKTLSEYITPIGKTYYLGLKFQNKFYTTGTRVYHWIKLIEHIPSHIYKFGRYLRICYDSRPDPITTTENNNRSHNSLQPENQPTPQTEQ